DNGYPSGGNYWSNYSGNDAFFGPDQDLPGYDGVGDVPYAIPGGLNQDNYPLMQPWNGTNITAVPENIPPMALNYTPNGTEVPIDAIIQITWNETMNWTSVEEGLMYGHDMVNWFYSDSGNWTHDETTNTSIFTPDFLEWNVEYGVMINSSARDLVGNLLDQDGDGVPGEFPEDVLSWIFTTIDAPPTILSTSPQHLDIEVDPNTNIMIEFSETMNTTSVENAFTFSGGGENFNITDGNVTWGILDKIMTFDPSYALKNDTSYIFKMEGTIARDLNNNLLDANGDNITGDDMILGFTTWLEPPAPSVVYGIPADGSTMVNVDTHIQIKFDFRMNTTTVEEAFTVTDGTHVLDESDGGFTWSNDHDLMTYQPNEFLNYEEDYTVRLLGTAKSYVGIMMDNNGNDIGDGSPIDDFVFTFATSPEPPQVSSTYPENGASRVLVTLDHINIVFDSSMDNDTVENAIRITPHIPANMTWDTSNEELSISPIDPLLFDTEYTITINGNVAKDAGGTLLDGNG
ncbi:MAG: Ig-like domain-containing protein, partial [Gammaproteobacteria bacterium]|nr:Ig-like domain-containing protein [Gammaproteobacteria bacterium]